MAINTFVIGVPIRVTQKMVAETFDMPDRGLNYKHEGFPPRVMIPHDNAPYLPFHERVLHLFSYHLFQFIRSKRTTVRHTDNQFLHHLQIENKINLLAQIFQDLIKIVRSNIKTLPYIMHLSYLIWKMGCNVDMNSSLHQSDYTSFDKHTFGRM